MKTVKITLAVIVVVAIIIAIIRGCMPTIVIENIQLPTNQFTKRIEKKIDSLKRMPDFLFCKTFHNEIKYYINDDYSNKSLGKTPVENEQWKTNLLRNLYAAYTAKFIKQAFYVFKGSEWDLQKLNFIRSEYQELKNNGYQSLMLEQNSITEKELNLIKTIFAKYDEIAGFINSCKSFSNYDNFNIPFPISTIENNIIRSKEYLGNNLENNYVNNCLRLKTNLSEVSQILFYAHVKYLDNKINYSIGKYRDYDNLSNYSGDIYTPLYNEIDQLDNNIYNIDSFDEEYNMLINKLKLEGNAAYEYWNP